MFELVDSAMRIHISLEAGSMLGCTGWGLYRLGVVPDGGCTGWGLYQLKVYSLGLGGSVGMRACACAWCDMGMSTSQCPSSSTPAPPHS